MASILRIIEVATPSVDSLMVPFCSASSSPKIMQDTVHALTHEVIAAAKAFDSTLTHATMVPVLRGALPMFVAAQPLLSSTSCILVRCSKVKGSQKVAIEWLGRKPFPQEDGDGKVVILDTIIATGDTVLQLCEEIWNMSGRTKESSVVVMCCYAAPKALELISMHPVVDYIVVAKKSQGCDTAGYLIPYTHGDIGDKMYGKASRKRAEAVIADGQDVQRVSTGVKELLRENGGLWDLTPDATGIERNIKFPTFKKAWAFMERVASAAAAHRHHPEWTNVYNTVHIRWTTHQPNGLTDLDVKMANLCDGYTDI
ncbi:hypothetical protein MGYG_03368 [Nannizzia gypsea CBS 118893]|uniref:4a-hydroxytetrahydrobiopterin dehydratase n=1 Tax=Arthroderma gypseum (strain ATCC MYA-4604 / CBS 118893) TaxID=535722 RepID=E4UN64_ARTGP|nr:hypothetical protein MGYG_03368 [Nannizzia gypsea CBS 118893]EFR00366.1 hypothetical protein MGYG_03368 [Nannizzia gypsea CBS 118893]